jgi:hypothetical protein
MALKRAVLITFLRRVSLIAQRGQQPLISCGHVEANLYTSELQLVLLKLKIVAECTSATIPTSM